ncbi:unnamed protein product [Cuscuta epithymum]|uniref:Secreted protein n=1 Tax=Cuscuta epithymum TaxID=186058 RepID=A0AAV0GJV6_9ASTE|nr:unnamed protein product [Cuscuta epithymum]
MTLTMFVFEPAVLVALMDVVAVRMDERWVVEIALCFDGFRIGWTAFEEAQSRQVSRSQNLGVLGCKRYQLECRSWGSYWRSCMRRRLYHMRKFTSMSYCFLSCATRFDWGGSLMVYKCCGYSFLHFSTAGACLC